MTKFKFFAKLRNYLQQQQQEKQLKRNNSNNDLLNTIGDSNGGGSGEDNTPSSPNTPRHQQPKRRNSIKLILNPIAKALTKDRKKKSANGSGNGNGNGGDGNGEDDYNEDETWSPFNSDKMDFASIRLEQVLDLNNIVEMCRDATDLNLIQYLSRRDVIQKLISYLVIDYTAGDQLLTLDNPSKNKALNAAVHKFIASQDQMDARQHGNSPRPPQEDFVGSPRPFDYTGVVISEQEDSTTVLKLRLKYPTLCSEILCSTLGQRFILPLIFTEQTPASPTADATDPVTTPTTSEQQQQESTSPTISSRDLQDFLFGFLDQDYLPLHLVRPYVQLMIHLIKVNSKITKQFIDFLYEYKHGHVLKRFVSHVRCTDDICELLLLCMLYHQKHPQQDSDSEGSENEEVVVNHKLQVKYDIIEALFGLITDPDYSENVSAILSTIVTLPPDSVLYLYLVGQGESILSMVDKIVTLSQNIDVQMQSVCAEVADFFCTFVLHCHSNDAGMQAIASRLPQLSKLLVTEEDDVFGPINDMVQPRPLGILRLKLVELFVIIFKHYPVLTGPVYLVRERRVRELLGESFPPQLEPNFENDLCRMLCTSNLLQHSIFLFFRYHNHSILHNLTTHLVTCLLENGLGPFISILLDECQLIQRILDAFERNKEFLMRTRVPLGFMGHLSIIGSCVDDHISISGALEGDWQRFRMYLEQKHFLECEYRHGGSIPLPENFRIGGVSSLYFPDD